MPEGIAVARDDIVKLLGKSGGFFVGQFKVHGPNMGVHPFGTLLLAEAQGWR